MKHKIEVGTPIYWKATHGSGEDIGIVIKLPLNPKAGTYAHKDVDWEVIWGNGSNTWEQEDDIEIYRDNYLDFEASLK